MAAASNVLVIDDFLGATAADALLSQIIASEANFVPTHFRGPGTPSQDAAFRSSLRLPGRVGVDLDHFKAAIHARFAALCAGTGTAQFLVHHSECSIVAHRDGDFYKTHIDTRTGDPGAHGTHVRVLSCVYYLNQRPPAFRGGELLFHPLGGGESMRVAPQHNRLAVFPSFIPHEVLPISSPSTRFADSRFSINCWLRRAVAQG